MAYTALYRKFRPSNFEDVKGQDHIVRTLKNQVTQSRLGHAYLFCGTRGTGKTSIAKILAKAVNCEHPVNGSPCNECAMCKSISSNSSMNVIEIDAASNNGVDNIRQINDEVAYTPAEGKYKVYIIDEVHMLSIGAFNALLKTLEEPPSYVIFILATTEAHKIPITILSRCQRYDFRRITIDTISSRLLELLEKEEVKVDEKAIRYIAKAADGSMRDALSLLDQCIAFYMDSHITYENVLEILGAVDTEVFSELLDALVKEDVSQAIKILDKIIILGRDLSQFVSDFIWYLRNLILIKASDNVEDIIDASKERVKAYKEESKRVSFEGLMRYIRILSELSNDIKYAYDKRVLVEIALIKLLKPSMENNIEELIIRINDLEEKLEKNVMITKEDLEDLNSNKNIENNKKVVEKEEKSYKIYEKAIPQEVKKVADNWRNIISKLPKSLKNTLMNNAKYSVGDNNKLIINFTDNVAFGFSKKEENIKLIEEYIIEEIQKEVKVEMKLLEASETKTGDFKDVLNMINMKVDIEEEDF